MDEVDFKGYFVKTENKNTHKVILMDHNKLSSGQTFLEPFVEEIIDHHFDEKMYSKTLINKVVEPVGSCCTLVAEEFTSNRDSSKSILDASLSKLLSGVILLDTVNFNSSAARSTPKDKTIFSQLLQISPEISPDSLFKKLQSEKFNVGNLSSRNLLRKDYKEWILESKKYGNDFKMGISSVTLCVKDWEKKDKQFLNCIAKYLEENHLGVLLVMTAFVNKENGKFARELILVVKKNKENKLFAELKKFLEESKKNELGVKELKIDDDDDKSVQLEFDVVCWEQENAAVSRKILEPILVQEFFNAKM